MSEIQMKLSVVVDRDGLAHAVDEARSAFVSAVSPAVTVTVADDKPKLCIGCGAERQPNGQMPCDH